MTTLIARQHTLRVALMALVALIVCIVAVAIATTLPQGAAPGTTQLESPLGVEDGYIAEGSPISPFDEGQPAISQLDPALRAAMQDAASAALADGIEFVVTSGWRSERYQQSLFDDAVRTYGSIREASRWVASVSRSAHVTGDAIDIGFTDANSWLSQHGSDYGLCQTYANEMWHFELATTPGGTCPPQLLDAS